MTLPDLLIDGCHPFLLMGTDSSVRSKALPGKTDDECLQLLGIELQLVTLSIVLLGKLSLVQAARRQPNPQAVVHQNFHAVTSAIGKEISAVRLRRTEDSHGTGERFLGAAAHIHGLGGQPDCVDANHGASPRTKRAQPSGSRDGHFSVRVCSPNGSSMIADASAWLFGATFTGTNAGNVAGGLSR